MGFAKIEEAIEAMKNGQCVIVMDDHNRENEGDLIIPAEHVDEKTTAFIVNHTSGVICIAMEGERLDELRLPLMVENNTQYQRTAFTVSVDCRHNTTTGISANDRMQTIKALINPETKPSDLDRPGHIFPLRAKEGGVLKRAGHTEAAVDLAKLAGCYPAGVICELVKKDGSMSRLPDLEVFAKEHGLVIISIADLIRYKLSNDKLVTRMSSGRIPTKYGDFTAYAYESTLDGVQHLALVRGNVDGAEDVLVRVHSECLTGDIFGSLRCDCGNQLDMALEHIADAEQGIVVYLRGHEGRGIGLSHKLRAYTLQDEGRDTVEANLDLGLPVDSREYGVGAQILQDLGVTTIHLLTNNPAKYGGLSGYNLEITERIPLVAPSNDENLDYLMAKKKKLGHLLEI
ncbi:Probable bifunctional riboflavin biosynthesis protein RIBA 2, chloroplastic [Chlamydiales bacterium SCGC AG-110-M15]|nr:Probable bifunctional riboflavin biosynthesis protein RIBA 2, chloroplastic [Chlamydiales bacterium SCGC AG-110-M15]